MFSQIVIIGRLGHDPVARTGKSGKTFTEMNVGVSTGFGEQKQTDWFSVTAFGTQGENAAKYLKKGSLVCVTGEFKTRSYEGKDGTKKTALQITASNVTFLKTSSSEFAKPVPSASPADQSQTNAGGFVDGGFVDGGFVSGGIVDEDLPF